MFGGATSTEYDDIVVKTTDENLTGENWELIMNLCDKVADEGQTGAHSVIGAILKRLAHRNPNVQLYALSLAEALSKNLGIEIRRELASRAFTQGLEKLITDRNTHEKVRKRALGLIAVWTEEFEGDSTLGIMEDCYNNLKAKNYKFEQLNETPPPTVDDEIRRKEEEELQRVLEMSMQDKGGRDRWAQYTLTGSSSGAGGSGSSSAAAAKTSTTSGSGGGSSSAHPFAQPKYQAGYVPARTPSPVAQLPPPQPQPQPTSRPQQHTAPPQTHSYSSQYSSIASSSAPSLPTTSTPVVATPATPAPAVPAASTSPAPASSSTTMVTRVRALYTFEPTESGELAFEKGDIIKVVDRGYKDWWRGQLKGRTGIFPVNYVEPLPEPTAAELAREAEQEAAVFAQAANVEKLLTSLRALDPAKDNLADNEEIQELYRSCMALRPKVVKLIDKYSQKRADLVSMNETFVRARTIFDRMMEESLARHTGVYDQPAYRPGPQGYPGPRPDSRPPPQAFGWNPAVFGQPGYNAYPAPANAYPPQGPPQQQPPPQGPAPYGPPGALPQQLPVQGAAPQNPYAPQPQVQVAPQQSPQQLPPGGYYGAQPPQQQQQPPQAQQPPQNQPQQYGAPGVAPNPYGAPQPQQQPPLQAQPSFQGQPPTLQSQPSFQSQPQNAPQQHQQPPPSQVQPQSQPQPVGFQAQSPPVTSPHEQHNLGQVQPQPIQPINIGAVSQLEHQTQAQQPPTQYNQPHVQAQQPPAQYNQPQVQPQSQPKPAQPQTDLLNTPSPYGPAPTSSAAPATAQPQSPVQSQFGQPLQPLQVQTQPQNQPQSFSPQQPAQHQNQPFGLTPLAGQGQGQPQVQPQTQAQPDPQPTQIQTQPQTQVQAQEPAPAPTPAANPAATAGGGARSPTPDQPISGPPPYVYHPRATYADPNVQAWASYYAQGGKELTGAVYFISVPGVTDGASAPGAGGGAQPQQGAQDQHQGQNQGQGGANSQDPASGGSGSLGRGQSFQAPNPYVQSQNQGFQPHQGQGQGSPSGRQQTLQPSSPTMQHHQPFGIQASDPNSLASRFRGVQLHDGPSPSSGAGAGATGPGRAASPSINPYTGAVVAGGTAPLNIGAKRNSGGNWAGGATSPGPGPGPGASVGRFGSTSPPVGGAGGAGALGASTPSWVLPKKGGMSPGASGAGHFGSNAGQSHRGFEDVEDLR